jgi:hypothetical protein
MMFQIAYFLKKYCYSVSTRVRGLVDGAREVQLSLLSSLESIEMLCSMADIPVDTGVPAEVVPIVKVPLRFLHC